MLLAWDAAAIWPAHHPCVLLLLLLLELLTEQGLVMLQQLVWLHPCLGCSKHGVAGLLEQQHHLPDDWA